MDINKYLTNKEIQLTPEDINFEKLEKDIRKGYVLSEEVEKARQEALKESTATYSELEDKYNKLEKSYNDMESRNAELTNNSKALKLEVEMVSQGFRKEDLSEVSKLRNSIYQEEEDDSKAISAIKERYGATFGFNKQVETPKIEIPNESNFNVEEKKVNDIKITRSTSLKDLIIK